MMNKKIMFVSLGCDKNLVDTEMMIGLLQKEGYSFTDDEREADIVVINTCCFIGDAKEESIGTILEFAEYKKAGLIEAVIVAGCLAQRYREEIQVEIEEVDAVVGTSAIDAIVEAVRDVSGGEVCAACRKVLAGDASTEGADCLRRVDTAGRAGSACREYFAGLDRAPLADAPRVLTTGGYYAYLKIAEGCDKRCTYCIIPKVRGGYRSIPMESLIREAERLAAGGVKELILVAQETTLYGVDLYGKKSLPELLRRLNEIEGLKWIRIMYCYPEEIDDELIRAVKELPKVCHYLDMPIQHASDPVLKRMGRKTTGRQIADVAAKLRREIPDICIRTTLIAGFPGETAEDHEELMYFLNEMEFDRLGVFPYSMEEDTPAALMEDQVDEELKHAYRDEIMELQQEIAFDKAEQMAGQVLEVMIEGKVTEPVEIPNVMTRGKSTGPDAEEDPVRDMLYGGIYVARSYKDAPGVDGMVFIKTPRELMSGDFVKVRITGSYEYDLIGVIEDELTE